MALTFEQYQKQALETNLGTIINETEPLLYPVMGMVDELSEVMEKYMLNASTEKEIGDAMWYYFVAMDSMDLNILEEIALVTEKNMPLGLNFSDLENVLLMPLPLKGAGIYTLALSTMYAGKALGLVKKIYRDKNGILESGITKPKIGAQLTKSFLHLCKFALDSGIDLEQAARDNLAKLKSRKERGKLQGSGDNR